MCAVIMMFTNVFLLVKSQFLCISVKGLLAS